MPHKVGFSVEADEQLRELGRYIAEKKSASVAIRYIAAITKACSSLATFPHRGTKRDRILRGLRTVGFRRRVTIAFLVTESTVEILAVLYGGQSIAKYFRSLRDQGSKP
jgi:toxin ParE1/3/4